MKKMYIAILLVLTMALACGCQPVSKETSGDKMTISAAFFGADNSTWKNDDYYNYISEKFDVEFDFYPLSWDNYLEKTRIWVSSGDMPDYMFSEFNFTDYVNYSKQGAVRALPDDYADKYPNLAAALESTKIDGILKSKSDGKLYCTPRSNFFGMDANSSNADMYGYVYRKDWAEEMGIDVNEVLSYDEMINLAKEFIKQDIEGNGENKTIGIAVSPTEAPNVFVAPENSYFKKFHKVDGRYIWGATEEATFAGLENYSKAYKEGVLDPNFYTHKNEDVESRFYAGKAGILFYNLTPNLYDQLKGKMKEANPDMDVDSALGTFVMKGRDGLIHCNEATPFWSATYFSPKMSDEKFAKILEIMDYAASDEGFLQVNLGLKGIDYDVQDGKPVILGDSAEQVMNKYPSADLFRVFTNLSEGFSFISPSIAESTQAEVRRNIANKENTGLSLAEVDYNILFFNGEKFDKFEPVKRVESMMAEVVVSDSDVRTEWNKKIAEIENSLSAVLAELNENIN